MALPSSPPLLPEDYDLPSAPIVLPLASGSSVPIRPLHRKRQHSDYGSLSSDPLFSDTTEEDDEGTDARRPCRKKLTRGPWWNVGRRSKHDLRRSMARKEKFRNADSGVWMGSDGSEDSIDSVMSSQQRMQELIVEDEGLADDTEADDEAPSMDAETYAARMIQDCLDRGKEVVNLGDLALNRIADSTLRPLHQLIRPSFTDLTSPPSEDEFSPLTPSITLILSTNQLTTLPTELFNLQNITVLSLRNNHLQELPPAIARLDRLQELNIASNSIRFLPWELLGLFERNTRITVRPNPLVQPVDFTAESLETDDAGTATEKAKSNPVGGASGTMELLQQKVPESDSPDLRKALENRRVMGHLMSQKKGVQSKAVEPEASERSEGRLLYLASSSVRYLNIDGTPVRQNGVVNSSPEDWPATLTPFANTPKPSGNSKTPSLFEVALRTIQSTNDLSEFLPNRTGNTSDYGLSTSIISALSKAASNTASHGNEACSTCAKRYIIARAEWMEYWAQGSHTKPLGPDTTLPFLRKACSWACAVPTEVGTFR